MGERMRGRAGQAALKRRRAQHPFCAECKRQGVVRAAVEMDHIQPLALGGEDVDANIQGLCLPCHAIKSATEDASAGGAANHPDWLRPASCGLTIVSGPPCGGKSTLVEREAGGSDLVIDLDLIAERLAPGFLDHRRWTAELLNRSVRARNALLGSLSRLPARSHAWFIVSCPTSAERVWWAERLRPVSWRVEDPGIEVAMRRAVSRGALGMDAVQAWYWRSRQPWKPEAPRRGRVACGEDGFPVEDGR